MSYSSQVTNSRSMNGIISYDDGNGGVLENGDLMCNNINADEQIIYNLEISNRLDLVGNLNVNSTLITPTWLSYLYGLTGNIQNQISSITSNILSTANTWTARQTFGNGSMTQYLNTNTSYPTRSSTSVGGIMGHTSNTKALHIVNANSNLTGYENSFMFDKQDTSTSMVNLMRLTNSGDLYLPYVYGTSSVTYEINSKQPIIDSINRLNASYIGTTGLVSNTEYDYLANVTSDIQNQFSAKQDLITGLTPLSANVVGGAYAGSVSDINFSYLSSSTSNIQAQIDGISTSLLSSTNTWTNPQTFSDYATFNNGIFVPATVQSGTTSTDSLVVADVSTLNRQYVTITYLTASATYTSVDCPSYISCNASGITIIIPSASSIGSGFICTIINSSLLYSVNIDATSGNIRYNTAVWPGGGGTVVNTSSAITIDPCQTIRLIANPSIWSII